MELLTQLGIALLLLAGISMAGCTWGEHATGWRLEVGVEPIQSIDNHAGLHQVTK